MMWAQALFLSTWLREASSLQRSPVIWRASSSCSKSLGCVVVIQVRKPFHPSRRKASYTGLWRRTAWLCLLPSITPTTDPSAIRPDSTQRSLSPDSWKHFRMVTAECRFCLIPQASRWFCFDTCRGTSRGSLQLLHTTPGQIHRQSLTDLMTAWWRVNGWVFHILLTTELLALWW